MFESIKPHLAALQKTIGYSVLSVIIAFIVAFTFHNYILTWITQPLNDALAEVGRIIDSQEKATWHLKSTDESNKSVEVITKESSSVLSAKKLQDSLEKAVSVANKELVSFLQDAVNATKELTETLKSIEQNSTHTKSSFDGQITTHQVGGAFFVALKVSFFAGLLGA